MSYSGALRDVAARRGARLPRVGHPEPLAGLEYPEELAIKREALADFWRAQTLGGAVEAIVPAARPRGYRTTTKRRAAPASRGRVVLAFPGMAKPDAGCAPSALDLPEHVRVYAWVQERLARPGGLPLARAMNWAVVRGDAAALALVLNVCVFDAPVIRAAKRLAEDLRAEALGVVSLYLYLDPTRSEYYLEAQRPGRALSFKKLFGPDWLEAKTGARTLRYPITAFSQVNGAMLAPMVEEVRSLLSPLEGLRLLDLYCGYGLFTLTAGADAKEAIGVDHDGPAIEAARGNAAHHRAANTRFLAGRIDAPFIEGRLRETPGNEAVLLDPPRAGTAPRVVEALGARRPVRVVHVCCGIDEIPREAAAWRRAGYRIERAVPMDLFAGTEGMELLLLLLPR